MAKTDRDVRDRLSEAGRGSRHFVVFAAVFSVFVNLLLLTGPLFMLQIYDRVLNSRSEETLVALLILVLGLYWLMWLLDFARTRLVARHGARIQAGLDEDVFGATLARGADSASAVLPRHMEALQSLYASSAFVALMDVPFTPLFIAAIYVFHPWLGMLALTGGLILIGITALSQVLTAGRAAAARASADAAQGFAENARGAADLIRSQGMSRAVTARWMERRAAALAQNMAAVDRMGAVSTFTRALRLSLQSLILALGAWLVLRGELTAGAMIAASILLGRALAPVEQILGRWPLIARAREARRALRTSLGRSATGTRSTRLPRPAGRLDLKGVTVTGGPGQRPQLYNVTFSLEPGEALGVVGRSGSGKTTIAKTLLNLVEPALGEVRLGGALVSHYDAEDLGRHIGYLPQDPTLITGTIAENIARMSLAPDSDMVVAAARKAKAHDLILSLPDGYDTPVRDNTIGLSGGQRQRIALARALYGDPVLLVLDEPNSALDQEGCEALNAAIRTAKSEDRSVIIMTHRPMAISECDRLLVIEGGQIKAIGPRDEIVKSMMRNAGDVQRVIEKVAAT